MNKLLHLIHTHAELLVNAAFCTIAIVFLLLGYGERQQADENAQSTRRETQTPNPSPPNPQTGYLQP